MRAFTVVLAIAKIYYESVCTVSRLNESVGGYCHHVSSFRLRHNIFGLVLSSGAAWHYDLLTSVKSAMENAFIYACVHVCKRAQLSGIGGSLIRQSTIELLGSGLVSRGHDGTGSIKNFVRMRERSFPAACGHRKRYSAALTLVPRPSCVLRATLKTQVWPRDEASRTRFQVHARHARARVCQRSCACVQRMTQAGACRNVSPCTSTSCSAGACTSRKREFIRTSI